MDSIDQEILSTWMERKAERESRKAVVSILAEIIVTPMVFRAPKDQRIIHQQRNKSILDVGGNEKCPNGVLRGRSFLNMDGTSEEISAGMDHALAASYLAGLLFHPLSALIESDGARKASSANFFHRPEAFPNLDGVKKLVLAHFSIAGKFISTSMDSEKASFPRVLHRQKAFLSSAGKKGQVDSIDQEILSTWMERKAERESRKAVVSILAEIIVTPMVSKAPNVQKIFHQPRNKSILDVQVI